MSADLWLVLLAVVLIVLTGLLVMTETAVGRVSRSHIEDLARDDVRGADRLLVVLGDRPRYVNVLLFLSTTAAVTATVLVSFVGVINLRDDLGWPTWAALLMIVVVMVVISYAVLGVAPRTLGRQHADRIALRSAGVVRLLASVLSPLATLLILIGNLITPGKGYREGPFATQAEFRELVDIAGDEDLIEDDERAMIHSVFELGDTFVREVMVPRTEMIYIERHKTLRQALSLGLRSGFSRIPVIGENADDVIGLVYLKDVVRRVFDNRDAEQSETVESLMRPTFMVPDSKQVDELLKDMQAARTHMAIVVDEYGGTAGLVTIEDLLEEIVGEIDDEYDTAAPEVAPLEDGAYRVSARMQVDDFADLIDVDIDGEDEGVDTVLGLMAKRLGRVPIPGAVVDVDGWRLRAEEASGRRNRIGSVLAVPMAPDPPKDEVDDDE
jgi:CBS domain containing-hemolysin-like protein